MPSLWQCRPFLIQENRERKEGCSVADAANAFAGVEGMDVVFTPAHSSYAMAKNNGDIRIVVKLGDVKSIEQYIRVVRLEETKKM